MSRITVRGEVVNAIIIRTVKCGIPSGIYGLTAEMLKQGRESMVDWMHPYVGWPEGMER